MLKSAEALSFSFPFSFHSITLSFSFSFSLSLSLLHLLTSVNRLFQIYYGECRTSYKQKAPEQKLRGLSVLNQTALVTLPERKQRVQACTLLGVPSTIAFTLCTLGLKVLFERLCE